ncbi:hypothetical protein W97_05996 [Coniosporium apollinis CBS 100218]|uniref:beta-glucosidase n=1 Tax=Coniosporium apollinis (strain CBS 100218) TaxID=1168221 RepID=R7YXT0_CONA1|nr:uncharacterized protein W97_05996 [Coniosporium apollinis CBS 100218]EON66750.1 hypothetical protein W97_05996 [Coniosporium apollinis CBS 100218]
MAGMKVFSLLAASSFLRYASAQDVIRNDTFFYGQSPPVYPSPEIEGLGDWGDAYAKAQAFVAQLTLEEKTNLTGGFANASSGCGGNIRGIPRLGFNGLCLQDAGQGVRATDFVNAYASGIHAGASWNKNLTFDRAYAMGGEFRAKGASIALGPPVVGPLGRIARGGRNWEGFSVDPYLSGILAAESVRGIQSRGVISCTKHFILNEQELNRIPTINAENETVEASSSNIDDRTMHELYMWPFADALHAGTASIMCSYERINNSYGCQNSKALNGLLKDELGYQGFVVSDWGAQESGVGSALAGLDMVMPSGLQFWGGNLTQAVRNGSVPEDRLTDMATRIMAAWYYTNQDAPDHPYPGIGLAPNLLLPHRIVDARDPSARPVILQGAIEGHVLVKNTNNTLPLRSPKLLSLYGYDAKSPDFNTPGPGFNPWSFGLQSHNVNSVICGFFGRGVCPPFAPIAQNGTFIVGGGSGANNPVYISAPYNAIQEQAIQDGTQLYWDFVNANANGSVHAESDACLVFINAAASEGVDRPSLRDDFSDALVTNIAAQCSNTIVTIHNAGIRLVDQWIENPNVTAVIFGHLPGQDSGRALVELLYGRTSPSGKLPYTVARNESDYGALLDPVGPVPPYTYFPQDDFREGVNIDYRAFDAAGIEPRFEFGFGLTYTTFEFANLASSVVSGASLSAYPTGPVIQGGNADLWDVIATVTASVTNTGNVAAAEVAQLYVGIPSAGQPVRQLRGFEKVLVHPNQTAHVEFELRRRDLSVWDVVAQQWRLELGAEYHVYVGSSSRDLPLVGNLTLA